MQMESKKEVNVKKEMIPKEKLFIEDTCNALIKIKQPNIPSNILEKARTLGLLEKPEFHISAIATRNGKIITDFLSASKKSETIKNQIREGFLKLPWKYELLDEYYLIEKFYNQEEIEKSGYKNVPNHNRSTLIQKIKLDDLHNYYSKLNKIMGLKLTSPFPHITLFSGSDYEPMANKGIGIYSQDDFNKYLKMKL